MNTYISIAAYGPLQTPWTEQFIRESEWTIERESIAEAAQTVLFYAGLYLDLETQLYAPLPAGEKGPWLLSEEEVVTRAVRTLPQTYHSMLQLCLLISTLPVDLELEAEEVKALRAQAVSFVVYVRKLAEYHFAEWFH
ncbi:hypothetical protein N0M98_24355 [Paenibacillus doosanensis]|uniref:Uncharacterized protein n=1 Tax=Paenibacillus konkukensis TaxID=2020716 RepID=A0ABY4RRQ8_9BACL|nr:MULTISPECIES: hypothetical protein [Paenibacillus]MCS7463260.1 hypothetical protein [Paenibacillus doosanensis]UQZ85206.1 hypothetical protein SK3146_04489 [Paenibacillus konkukensis]